MFLRWGRFTYVHRRPMLAAFLLFLAFGVLGILFGVAPRYNAQPPVEAGRAAALINHELPTPGDSFDLVFASDTLRATDPAFRAALESAVAPLTRDRRVTAVETPYSRGGVDRALVSRDGHMALVLVSAGNSDDYPALRREVRSSRLRVAATGNFAVNHDINTYLNGDLARTSGAVLPIALLLLLIVFGTVVAAVLPLGIAVLALVAGLGSVFLLGRITDITQYATNLDALIGLGVAIDYSLFIVSRFRSELASGRTVEESVTVAVATSGRAVVFSGLTVAIGLSGMVFYQGIYLQTMGLAGAVAVLLAVACALSFLPALLAVLGPRVNVLRVPLAGSTAAREGRFWQGLARWVMERPVLVLFPTLVFLAVLVAPILQIRLAAADIRALPPQAPSRQGYDLVTRNFPGAGLNDILVVLDYPAGSPLTPNRATYMYDLHRHISGLAGVRHVLSPVDAAPGLRRSAAAGLSQGSTPAVRQALHLYVGRHIVELDVQSGTVEESDAARALVRTIRALPQPPGGRLLVTGATAFDIDAIDYVEHRTVFAVLYIIVVTYILLFLVVGSVVLPLKAVLMNLLSISASFGALVWIFQQGHLRDQLNFTPQPIDPTNLVLLFSIVFGLSMDYEVFLLTRIQEEYRRTGETRSAVATGLARSARLITGAAAIMVGVFLAFGGLANTVIIKEIGLGLAIAVALDATIVRGLVAPSFMRLLGRINWWAPSGLAAAYHRLGLAESPSRESMPGPLSRDPGRDVV